MRGSSQKKNNILCAFLFYGEPRRSTETRNEIKYEESFLPPHETRTHPLSSCIPPLLSSEREGATAHEKR